MREHHWSPSIIDELFLDDADYRGALFVYNDIVEVNEKIKRANKR